MPGEQISEATSTIFETFKKLSPTSKSNISIQHMGGPVMMMRIYYLLFESPQGWRLVLWFSVVINVNLALMNMLPIPPLDGSHITLAIVELIRGRPPGVRTQWLVERIQIAGTMLVIGFMLFITVFDVQDVFGGKSAMRFQATCAQVGAHAARASRLRSDPCQARTGLNSGLELYRGASSGARRWARTKLALQAWDLRPPSLRRT